MSQPIIEVRNVSKKYRLGEFDATSLREETQALWDGFRHKFLRKADSNGSTNGTPIPKTSSKDFWALHDVSFTVQPGEVLGIIGRNGAGKSTLLKILSRITEPTEGEVIMRGRVASLLEVGTGFHPELSGRENIYLNGAILGMRKLEINRKFDEIVAFADVERFIDTPVKRYSSGMYVRLAFAVAAHLDPEILIVDEVLAVGDFAFQQKCLTKIRDVAGTNGRTVIFVSHNMQAVSALCSRAILLEKGRILQEGSPIEVSASYLQTLEGADARSEWSGDSGDDTIRLKSVRIVGSKGGGFLTSDPIRIRIAAEILKPVEGLIFAIEIYSNNRQLLAYTAHDDALPPPAQRIDIGSFNWEILIPANTLATGTYEFRTDIGIHNGKRLVDERVSLTIAVENLCGIGLRFPSGWANCFRPSWIWDRVSEVAVAAPTEDAIDGGMSTQPNE